MRVLIAEWFVIRGDLGIPSDDGLGVGPRRVRVTDQTVPRCDVVEPGDGRRGSRVLPVPDEVVCGESFGDLVRPNREDRHPRNLATDRQCGGELIVGERGPVRLPTRSDSDGERRLLRVGVVGDGVVSDAVDGIIVQRVRGSRAVVGSIAGVENQVDVPSRGADRLEPAPGPAELERDRGNTLQGDLDVGDDARAIPRDLERPDGRESDIEPALTADGDGRRALHDGSVRHRRHRRPVPGDGVSDEVRPGLRGTVARRGTRHERDVSRLYVGQITR